MIVIGLCGTNCSGKGTVAAYLEKKGFYYKSLSDVIRKVAKEKKIKETRENLIKLGNTLRKRYGNDYLANEIIKELSYEKNYVIDSIRNVYELKKIKELKNSFVLWVDAPLEIRFERCLERKRVGDIVTLEDFKRVEREELEGKDESTQQLLKCKKLCDYNIINNSTKEKLYENIYKILKNLKIEDIRPSWDRYFLDIAKIVSSRSNCLKRKTGAIIVKDRRIISTGYNGTPRGVKNCNENGCPRCRNFADSGKNLEECYCSHAEENAIVQAAYHGISIKDSIMYSTYAPCLLCAKMIINAGIRKVIYNKEYPLNKSTEKLFREAKIELIKVRLK